MNMTNKHGQRHIVHADYDNYEATIVVSVARESMKLIKLSWSKDITFIEAMTRLKNIINLDDDLYTSIAMMHHESEELL